MGKHEGERREPSDEDKGKFHTDVRNLPTYHSPTPYDKATENPAPVDPKPKHK